MQSEMESLGFVVIGRNEGARLESGLRLILKACPGCPVVYVDSGSTDDSVPRACSLGVIVVELDMTVPFTAARARNAGFERLLKASPNTRYVQFLDGDCYLSPDWPAVAVNWLNEHPDVAIVSGRRREARLDASIFNALIDIEWNTQIGEVKAVLGDMCVRSSVFLEVNGFRQEIIAAEDDEFCIRVRAAGFQVYRLDADMSEHDANITRLGQWYRRSVRGGYGYANINHLHGAGPDRYFKRELYSVLIWGGLFPLLFTITLLYGSFVAGLLFALYIAQMLRVALKQFRRGTTLLVALTYGAIIYTGKVPEVLGVLKYWKNHILVRDHTLIEYR